MFEQKWINFAICNDDDKIQYECLTGMYTDIRFLLCRMQTLLVPINPK